jgi:mycothiol synthase
MPDPDEPRRAEHGLTAVRRDWRRRGVATALKRTTLAWAAANGLGEVYTWTQRDNDGMRALNTRLGFRTRSESITMQAALPLACS